MPSCRPLTDNEIQEELERQRMELIWPSCDTDGKDIKYNFVVVGYDDKPSKSGLEMLTFTLDIFNKSGERKQIRTWLPFVSEPSKDDRDAMKKYYFMMSKVKDFYYSIGLNDWYDEGKEMTGSEALQKSGYCHIANDGQYNKVDKFLAHEGSSEKEDENFDDDLPF
jgi:hypothetical protein